MDYLFRKYDLASSLANQPRAIQTEIDGYGEDYLLGASEDDLVAFLVQKFAFHPPALGDPMIASDQEVEVEHRGSDYGHDRTFKIKETRVVLHVPFTGDKDFFLVRPNQSHLTPPRATIAASHLELVFQEAGLRGEQVKQGLEKVIRDIDFHLDQIKRAAETHNAALAEMIRPLIRARKRRILERRQMVSAIGLPVKRRDGALPTYTVPDIRRRPEIKPPAVREKAFVPEPTLVESEYENILSIMRSMVRVMEASPHAFASLKEEDLRQHFLMQLNGQYQGRATGETFNYEGKTDILIREGDRNVFIAECKFWKGKESLLATIDQVLGYLHWRDTKAAIVLFNRNKDFSNVLAQVAPAMESHASFKRMVRQVSETEWRFIFRNKDDRNRELHLAVLVFDIPAPGTVTKS